MLRLRAGSLSPAWFEFLTALFRDLEPLGHFARVEANGDVTIGISVPADDKEGQQQQERWARAHELRHRALLRERSAEILAFEDEFAPLFVDTETFQPSAVQPVLQVIDFRIPQHLRIVEYLKLCQSVTSRKAVGRRMGLFIWDAGQSGSPRLFGAAILASARFSQRIRDRHFNWQADYPKTSPRHSPVARAIRVNGLGRIMQLSVACALPPYNMLSGAWLAAMAPFTDIGLEAFRKSLKTPDPHADLAAIVTTTGLASSGAPFRQHRINQIAPKGVLAASGASGNLFSRVKPPSDIPPLRASFESLVSKEVRDQALALFKQERPERYAKLRSPDRSAMAYALRRLGLRRSLFDGNEIGIHVGVLGAGTLSYLETGQSRPVSARPILDWNQVVDVWTRKFLPAPATVGESAEDAMKAMHREGRQRRIDAARKFPQEQVRLSYFLNDENATRVRLVDLAPRKDPNAAILLPELELSGDEPAPDAEKCEGDYSQDC